ncbi:MAG: polyprenyl synthetase family protein [Alphaproteobacteria bacterium]|nr:polyprenyl synthetase family protein [Alphaproteobacteria bacterium]
MNDVLDKIKRFSKAFNAKLPAFFKKTEGYEKRVIEAMEYAVLNGGKRLRPFLVSECAKLFDKTEEDAFFAGVSLEFLHTYSLVHDDLPAMDNDDFRRGKPTCHKAFDEATAVLAGDGLLTYAFEILADSNYDEVVKIKLIKLLSKGAGAFGGMVAGQMLDLYAENAKDEKEPLKLIENIEKMKTGCLLKYACEAGAVIGNADDEHIKALCVYARKIGQTFQISDDILDVIGDEKKVGKTLKKDEAQNKLTFVSTLGLEGARQKEHILTTEAKDALHIFGDKAKTLRDLADFIVEREY